LGKERKKKGKLKRRRRSEEGDEGKAREQ